MGNENNSLPQMHPYQIQAKDFVVHTPRCGLFLDCGLGKSRITLEALREIAPPGHILIIAPKTIARSTWLDEIEKWQINVNTKSLIVNDKGKDLTRQKRLQRYADTLTDPPTMYFINRELIPDLIKNLPVNESGKQVWPFPTVVIDELQSFKSHSSMRFKSLQKVMPCITRLIGLTGTPTPNGLMDLWSEIYLMDEGARLGKNITAYRNTFFTEGRYANGFCVQWNPKYGAENEIYKRIGDIVISMKNDNLKLPPLTYHDANVYMDDEEKKLYKTMMQEKVIQLEGDIEVTAANVAVLQSKLSQMASGAIYNERGSHEYTKIHSKKLEMCQYIIENTDGPVLIAYHFQSDMEMLMEYFGQQKPPIKAKVFDGSSKMQKDWNAGEIPVMLLQPASAGHGINIQYGGHTLVWYTLPMSLEEYIQCNARIYRQGQEKSVIIHRIITKGTVDEKIKLLLERKAMNQQELLDAVRVTIKESL